MSPCEGFSRPPHITIKAVFTKSKLMWWKRNNVWEPMRTFTFHIQTILGLCTEKRKKTCYFMNAWVWVLNTLNSGYWICWIHWLLNTKYCGSWIHWILNTLDTEYIENWIHRLLNTKYWILNTLNTEHWLHYGRLNTQNLHYWISNTLNTKYWIRNTEYRILNTVTTDYWIHCIHILLTTQYWIHCILTTELTEYTEC